MNRFVEILSSEEYKLVMTQFHLSQELGAKLEKYYLLHWSTEYFLETALRYTTIIHQDKEYLILYEKDNLKDVIRSKNVAVSFRFLGNGISNYGYALVKKVS